MLRTLIKYFLLRTNGKIDSIKQRFSFMTKILTAKRLILIILFFTIAILIYFFVPVQYHWKNIFRPATLAFISGRSPYSIDLFFNPPWALIPLIPFALLSEKLGNALIATVTVFVYGYASQKFGAKWWSMILFVLLPQNLYSVFNVNLEWLVVLGFLLPPKIGIIFLLIKPQAGLPLALWWVISAWQQGGIKQINRIIIPSLLLTIGWILIYGLNGIRYTSLIENGWSFWPFSLPIGLVLLVASIRRRNSRLSILSAPMLAPYTAGHVWPLALYGLLPSQIEFLAGIIGLWILWFVMPAPDLMAFIANLFHP